MAAAADARPTPAADPPGAALGSTLGLIALAFLPLLSGGYSGTGYQVSFVVLPLGALIAWLSLPRRPLAVQLVLLVYLLGGLAVPLWVQAGRIYWFTMLALPCAWLTTWALLARVPSRRGWLLPAITISAVLTGLYGWFLWLGNGALHYQINSTFGLHNSYAGYLLLAWPASLLGTVLSQRWWVRLLYGLAGVYLAATLVLTYSRASWVAFAAQLVALALYLAWRYLRGRGTGRTLLYAGGGLLAAVAGLLLLPSVQSVLPTFSLQDYSVQGRLRFWQAALEMFASHPLLGVGPGNFAYVYPQYQQDYIYYSVDPHSWPLQLFSELGLVGVLITIALLAGLFFWGRRLWRGTRGSPVAILLLAAVGGSLLHALVDFDYTFTATTALLGALLAWGTWLATSGRAEVPGALEPGADSTEDGLAGVATGTAEPGGQEGKQRRGVARTWHIIGSGVLVLLLAVAVVAGELLTAERFYLDQLRSTRLSPAQRYETLMKAARYNPLNHTTRYQLAQLLAQPGPLRDRDEAREQVDWAVELNERYAVAWALKGLLRREDSYIEAALEIDPYNYPDHYWYYATLADDPEVRRERLLLGLRRIPITKPITPQHVRPTWYELNPLFAEWYYELARVTEDERQAAKYRRIAAEFEAYWDRVLAQRELESEPQKLPGDST